MPDPDKGWTGMAAHIYFAIGDIHGESAKLAALHDTILDRIAFENAPARIVHLGDYVDRGPDTRDVIERVMALESRFRDDDRVEVISLMGNHEQMMLNAYDGESEADSWWKQGGAEAADSYAGGRGRAGESWRNTIPNAHIAWLRTLAPIYLDAPRALAFVHAGIDPATFPDCDTAIRLWTRSSKFFEHAMWPNRPELRDLLVVHGHTPRNFLPEVYPHRINVDTGACFGGPLTAVMLKEGQPPQFLRAP